MATEDLLKVRPIIGTGGTMIYGDLGEMLAAEARVALSLWQSGAKPW